MFTNEQSQLWSYWTKFHEIFTQYRGIIYAVNTHIAVVISHSISEWQSDKCRGLGNFAPCLPLNWLPWQRPSRYWKKRVGLIICNSIPTIWCKDCENRSRGSWDTLAPSEQVCYDTKLVAMSTSLEILKKNFRSIIYTQKAFMWCKNCKNRAWFVFFLVHKIGCHGNVPEELEKMYRIDNTHTNTFHLVKRSWRSVQ